MAAEVGKENMCGNTAGAGAAKSIGATGTTGGLDGGAHHGPCPRGGPCVVVRIRPAVVEEGQAFCPVYAHTKKAGRVMVSSEEDERERLQFFDFDGVLDQDSTNDDVC
jgi:hypothetical protein